LKKFGKAIREPDHDSVIREPDRDSIFNRLWNDPNLRTGQGLSDPHFRTLLDWQEDGSFIEQRFIQDVGGVLVQYCKVYWRPAPASRKIERPGRRKGFAMRGSKIRELRNKLGLTQRALAGECKPPVSAREIMRAERGQRMAEGLPENLAATFTRLLRLDTPITARDLLRK
jgi:hypothetical protein